MLEKTEDKLKRVREWAILNKLHWHAQKLFANFSMTQINAYDVLLRLLGSFILPTGNMVYRKGAGLGPLYLFY